MSAEIKEMAKSLQLCEYGIIDWQKYAKIIFDGCQPPFTLWNCQESKCKCFEKVQRGGKEVKNMEI